MKNKVIAGIVLFILIIVGVELGKQQLASSEARKYEKSLFYYIRQQKPDEYKTFIRPSHVKLSNQTFYLYLVPLKGNKQHYKENIRRETRKVLLKWARLNNIKYKYYYVKFKNEES